jgi:hypothetical protein
MLRKFAAALIATTLIAGPALAAPPAGSVGSPAINAPASTTVNAPAVKHAKMVKHFRGHVVRHKIVKTKMARHFKAPRHHVAAPLVKHTKFSKVGKVNTFNKVNKTSRINKTNRSNHS